MENIVSVFDVVDYFLYQTAQSEEDDQMTHLRLQKLVYYAQGYHLAKFGKPLFNEKIEAWTHGPVVPELYHKYKNYGGNVIVPLLSFDFGKYTDEQLDLLNNVWCEYSQYTAIGLRNMTHYEKPWVDTERNKEIPIEVMHEFFKNMIDNVQ